MRPALLCILDGFGIAPPSAGNAVSAAKTPNLKLLLSQHPNTQLEASGPAVGLPAGQVGNSEVGHLTIGGGRVIQQELLKINQAIEHGELATNLVLQAISNIQPCHIISLISDGGVHSHINHTIAIAKLLKDRGIKIMIHAISDGRDCNPKSVRQYLTILEQAGLLRDVVTLTGRYYAMDRDQNWARTATAYKAIAKAEGERASSIEEAVTNNYDKNIGDEFFLPYIIGTYQGIQDGDTLLVTHYRGERIRQLLSAILIPGASTDGSSIVRQQSLSVQAIGMISYGAKLDNVMHTLFTKPKLHNSISEVMARAGYAQLKVAETEKYAHVTYFLNGGHEEPWNKEERVLIHSPKVATYDLTPQMSAAAITDAIAHHLATHSYQLICVNYANADMIGHTGNLRAAIMAIEALDQQLGKLMELTKQYGFDLWITADHGNIEKMLGADQQACTAHTMNPVPLIYCGNRQLKLHKGGLADVAPTVLQTMGMKVPPEMTGKSLVI